MSPRATIDDGSPAAGPPHLVDLGGDAWRTWRECAVRGAGFPAAEIEAFCEPELAELGRRAGTSSELRAEYEKLWPAALERSRAATRKLAGDPRFREAVAWQNPAMVRNCLDVSRPRRKHELAIASYAQRYLVKNDTIGFFGPLAWASWTEGELPLRVTAGPALLARRKVYFETWAIDALADRLAGEPELQRWLRPRLVGSCLLDGALLRRPQGPPQPLSPDQLALLERCDGTRTVGQLAAELGTTVAGALLADLRSWRDAGVLRLGLDGPVEARPELTLRAKLAEIGEAGPRRRALAALAEMVAARDAVAAAAGDAEAVLAEIAALERCFERVTGRAATRRPGEVYAGRALVYLDAQRDAAVELGRPLLELLAPPLTLLLDSARWLVARTAHEYGKVLGDIFERCRARSAPEPVPLAMLLTAATPHFLAALPQPVARAQAEFQQRWARILRIPPGVGHHTVTVESISPAVREAFPPEPAPWSSAVCHSPDILLAVPSGAGPWAAGDITAVLGELHLARNTLENRPLVEFHEAPARLLAAVEADYGGGRAYYLPPKEWLRVSPRTYPSPLLSPRFTYWCLHDDNCGAPGQVLPAAGMTVHRDGDRLVVRSRQHKSEYDLLELLGEHLSEAVVDAFKVIASGDHRPRLTIDRLVVQRESWTLDTGALQWAAESNRAERFRLAQGWRAAQRLPPRAFYQVAGEKPRFVDFRSPSLVELLAKAARRSGDRLSLTEMLPDLDQLWLADGQGRRYTAELRLVAVDHHGTGRSPRMRRSP